jgi:hypothetical protein
VREAHARKLGDAHSCFFHNADYVTRQAVASRRIYCCYTVVLQVASILALHLLMAASSVITHYSPDIAADISELRHYQFGGH